MSKYQEVETKHRLLNSAEVIRRLIELKCEHILTDECQTDTYYTPPHRDFLANDIVSEWLRIREANGRCSINFKQWLPIGAEIQNRCDEYESAVSDAFAVKRILCLLDFREIAVVKKKRNSWMFQGVEISIDEVEGLGTFIELEAAETVREDKIDEQYKRFAEMLDVLDARTSPRDRRGYPYQIIELAGKQGEGNVF